MSKPETEIEANIGILYNLIIESEIIIEIIKRVHAIIIKQIHF